MRMRPLVLCALGVGIGCFRAPAARAQERPVLTVHAAHTGRITALAVSPDGKYLATGSDDHTVKLRDAGSGRILQTLDQGGELINAAFSRDGNYLVTCGNNREVHVWETASGKPVLTIPDAKYPAIVDAVLSPDGSTLASVGRYSNQIELWSASSGMPVRTLTGQESGISSIAFAPGGKSLVSCGRDGSVTVWETASGRVLATMAGRAGRDGTVAVTPDGRYIVYGGGEGEGLVNIWSLDGKKLAGSISVPNLKKISLSPDGGYIAAADRDGIKCWELSTKKLLHSLTTDSAAGAVAVYGAAGRLLLLYGSGEDVVAWDAAAGRPAYTAAGNSYATVRTTALSPDGRYLASCSRGETQIRIWETASGRLFRILDDGPKGGVTSLLFSGDGSFLAQGSAANTINLWDVTEGKIVRALKWGGKDEALALAAAEKGGGTYLVSWHSSANLRLWDMRRGKLLNTMAAGSRKVFDLVSSGKTGSAPMLAVNDRYLFLGHSDGSIRAVELLVAGFRENAKMSGALRGSHKGRVTALAADRSGRLLVSGGEDGTVKVFDLVNGSAVAALHGHKAGITAVAAAPDGRSIVSGDGDGGIVVWDLPSKAPARKLKGHSWTVRSLAFTPDGTRLISGGGMESLVFRNAGNGEPAATIVTCGGNGHITYTPDGYFDYSPEAVSFAAQCLSFVSEGGSSGLYTAAPFHKPELIAERVGRR